MNTDYQVKKDEALKMAEALIEKLKEMGVPCDEKEIILKDGKIIYDM